MEEIKQALTKNLDAFVHEAEAAEQIKYGSRLIRQTIHDGAIVMVEELERKVSWKKGKAI